MSLDVAGTAPDELAAALEDALRQPVDDPAALTMGWLRLVEQRPAPAFGLAPRLAQALRRSGALPDASLVAELTLADARVRGEDVRALALAHAALVALDRGEPPSYLTEAVSQLTAMADRLFAKDSARAAARPLALALEALFHRTMHAEDLLSPLATAPADFLRPLTSSATYQALQPGSLPAPPPPTATRRLLAVSDGNWTFIDDVLTALADRGVEVRRLDLSTTDVGRGARRLRSMVAARLDGPPGADDQPPAAVRESLAWADTVWVDWCTDAAVWASRHVPDGTRLIVRLHSIEALSTQPHVVDWSRVSDVVFVSAALRGLARAAVPALRGPGGPRLHVVANHSVLAGFDLPKHDDAWRTLALVGWAQTVKDPIWALQVLATLRREDPAWRLLLVGPDFPQSVTARGAAYRDRFAERVQRADVRGAVERLGYRSDLDEVFRSVGFVLSTSRRESFHVGLLQGAASGAVPVVRDWPLLRRYGGPRTLYPRGWVVESPHAAAKRILRHADAGRAAAAGARARRAVWSRYRSEEVLQEYERLLQCRT